MKYTPGPWIASEHGDYSDFNGNSRVILGSDMRIAAVHDDGEGEGKANARLAAAAPEMLFALEKISKLADRPATDLLESARIRGVMAEIADQAIRKARDE